LGSDGEVLGLRLPRITLRPHIDQGLPQQLRMGEPER
jgi:hypothetical protein